MKLGESQVLFELPQPLDPRSGRTWTGYSHVLNGFKKSRRSEIVVAVDGESITIYNVKRPHTVASYALPPQCYLTAPPCCVYDRSERNAPLQRHVFASVRGSSATDDQIFFFTESIVDTNPSLSSTPSAPRRLSSKTDARNDPIVYIEPMCRASRSSKSQPCAEELLCVHKSGKLLSLTLDLSTHHFETHISSALRASSTLAQATAITVEFSLVINAQHAFRGFLKGKPDLFSSITSRESDPVKALAKHRLLCTVLSQNFGDEKSKAQHMFAVFHLHSSGISPLAQWYLPRDSTTLTTQGNMTRYAFDVESGSLSQQLDGSLTLYSLCTPKAKIMSKFRRSPIESFSALHLSGSNFLISSPLRCTIFNAWYNTPLTSRDSQSMQPKSYSRKRKRVSEPHEISGTEILQYFPRIKLALGHHNSCLVSYPILSNDQPPQRTGLSSGCIADVLGKGSGPTASNAGYDFTQTSKDDPVDVTLSKFHDMSERRNVKKFESSFFELRDYFRDDPVRLAALHDLTLSKIFSWAGDASTRGRPGSASMLKFRFVAPKVFECLIQQGHVTPEGVQRAFRLHAGAPHRLDEIHDEDIVDTIANIDQSSRTLLAFVQESPYLPITSLIQSMRKILQSFDHHEILAVDENNDAERTESEDINETALQRIEDAAGRELEVASNLLENGLKARATILKVCMHKVAVCFAPSEVSQALRLQMTEREIVLLLELVRFELSGGGWTSRLLDIFPTSDSGQTSDDAIAAICMLLNCAIDALGAGGFLLSEATTSFARGNASLITALQGETTDVLEGVQESAFLVGFLKDFLRYEMALNSEPRYDKSRRGRISHLDGDHAIGRLSEGMLPLGINSAKPVSRLRTGAGGEIQKRSARDIENKKSRQLGAYTFETVNI